MESKAHYALIGAFVLMFAILVTGFVAWFSNAQFDQQYDEYDVVFTGPVRGLTEGSEVRYIGLRVGEVTRLRLDPEQFNTVMAKIQVTSDTPVHTNSYAQLEPLGLTGMNYIQIFSGGESFPLLKDLPGRGPYRIPGRMSQIDSFVEGGSSVIEQAQTALKGVNTLLDAEAVEDFQQILKNVRTLTDKLADLEIDSESLRRLLATFEVAANDVSEAAIAVDVAAVEAKGLMSNNAAQLLARAEVSLAEVDKALANIAAFAADGTQLTTDTRDAINRLSNSGLTDIEETTDQILELVTVLNRAATQLEQSPIEFIAGEEKPKVKLPQ